MIGFLQPLALLGLLAASIPPILHLVARRLPPVVPFPAVRYLSETERRHSRRLKLRNLLLLLLRTPSHHTHCAGCVTTGSSCSVRRIA